MDMTLNLASPAIRKRRRLHQLAVGGLCLNLLLGLGNVLLYTLSQADLRSSEEQLRQQQELVQERERNLARDRKSTRLNSSHSRASRMPSSA